MRIAPILATAYQFETISFMTTTVAHFLTAGCGRCQLAATPQCKVVIHRELIEQIREVILDFPFAETMKWGQLCYTANGKNSILLSAVKGAAVMSFFRGFELPDPSGILEPPGNESRYARVIKLVSSADFKRYMTAVKSILSAAYEVEFSETKVKPPTADMSYPAVLNTVLAEDPLYKQAFERLTPGKQRGYLIYFRQAKQESTCKRRIENCREKVMKGEAR